MKTKLLLILFGALSMRAARGQLAETLVTQANISGGSVSSITVLTPGSGYSSAVWCTAWP